MVTGDFIGVPLADVDAISYFTYRDSASTGPSWLVATLNMVIDFNGPAMGGFATLVWEPNVPGGPGAVASGSGASSSVIAAGYTPAG